MVLWSFNWFQGDPSSPLIFILCFDFLASSIDKYNESLGNDSFWYSAYADDMIINLNSVTSRTVRSIIKIFDYFGHVSGL